MAAVGTVLAVLQTLFAALDSPVLKKIPSLRKILGYESELHNLKNTISTVNAVLLDVEAKEGLSYEVLDWIEKLRVAVYDADDLMDEFITIAEHKHLMEGSRFSKEVHLFFSRFNQLAVAYSMSRGIKKIRKQLDAINHDHAQFGMNAAGINESVRIRSRETGSYVYEQHVIGREDEKKAILDILLDPNVEGDVSFITIVGIGGLGKTTLARLVCNDKKIKDKFPLRLWACVCDHKKPFDMKTILCKILESTTGERHEGFQLDVVQRKLREKLQGEKYLLVLDDVWSENRNECLELQEFLRCGGQGSKVVVTTRSRETGRAMRSDCVFDLKGLLPEKSWLLFKKMAFDQGQGEGNPDLIEIGKDIVRKCANVPLVIRIVGSLLHGQSKEKWLSVKEKGLANIGKGENDFRPIFKLSYYHLNSNLKSCFSYCAVFPKDFVMEKETLISLWMAQGYIKPLDEDQSIDDAGEEYFSILLRRCFFQDVKEDEYGEIVSCKVHDLMHDIAQEVAGKDICVADSISSKLYEEIRHIFNASSEVTEHTLPKGKIRTYLHRLLDKPPSMDILVTNWKYLRALELRYCQLKDLPSTIGDLLHLRYLDLSDNWDLKELPKEITKLLNLQTLKLYDCCNLEALPRDLSMLRNLRVLVLTGCRSLNSMPPEMDRLTRLCTLTDFKVNGASSDKKHVAGKLEDLIGLTNLKGGLKISITKNVPAAEKNGDQGVKYIRNKKHLRELYLKWPMCENGRRTGDEEALLEDLQPHPNLKGLTLVNYCGVIPSWATREKLKIFLPNLVRVTFQHCKEWQYLPFLRELRYLKIIELSELPDLEYIEKLNNIYGSACASRSETAELLFFPSLEELKLKGLPELKGWWMGDNQVINKRGSSIKRQPILLPSFPRLSHLRIDDCKSLMSIPLCPNMETLQLFGFNERLQLTMDTRHSIHPKLRHVETDDTGCLLKSLSREAIQFLSEITIHKDKELESLLKVREVFLICSSSLQSITIRNCYELRSFSGALDCLTALRSLTLWNLPKVANDMTNGICWKSLCQSLRSLHFEYLENLVELPNGMHQLVSLESLWISSCNSLKCLPEWISYLSSLRVLKLHECSGLTSLPNAMQKITSLRRLEISSCSLDLKSRCNNPNGKDWPKIQHIPYIYIDWISAK